LDSVNVGPAPTLEGEYWCEFLRDKERLEPWDPTEGARDRKTFFEGGLSYDQETQLYVSVFFDRYTSAPTRYKSTGGLYLSICNQRQADQRKMENVMLLSLVPPNVPFHEIWEHYRKELKSLEIDGVTVYDGTKETVHKVRLAMFKADSPQRSELADHFGVTASHHCPRCHGKKCDVWNLGLNREDHFRVGFIQALYALKSTWSPEVFEKICKKYGFHGQTDLFKDLNFDPFLLISCEAYHLLFLGILKFFFRHLVKRLIPFQRDILNFYYRNFKFPGHLPQIHFGKRLSPFLSSIILFLSVVFSSLLLLEKSGQRHTPHHAHTHTPRHRTSTPCTLSPSKLPLAVCFRKKKKKDGEEKHPNFIPPTDPHHLCLLDITSVTKNFSMTFMQQVSSVLGEALNLIGVNEEIATFWCDLDDCVRAVFQNTDPQKVVAVKEKFIQTLNAGKRLFPEATKRRPQNLHNVLEFLEVDLDVWVSAYLVSGAREENKHQVFKGGAVFTNGVDSEGQLVERDRVISALRLLLHGGNLGGASIQKEWLSFKHPNNNLLPHPLLSTVTSYAGKSDVSKKIPVPRKFVSEKKRQVMHPVSPALASELAPLIQTTSASLCVPSQQVLLDDDVFRVGDDVVLQDPNG